MPFSYQINATNTPTSYSASGLPLTLFINSQTGLISGTPAMAGVFNILLGVTNVSGNASLVLQLNVSPSPPGPPVNSIVRHRRPGNCGNTLQSLTDHGDRKPHKLWRHRTSLWSHLGLADRSDLRVTFSIRNFRCHPKRGQFFGNGHRPLTLIVNPSPGTTPVITSNVAGTTHLVVGNSFTYAITAGVESDELWNDGSTARPLFEFSHRRYFRIPPRPRAATR